VSFDQWTAPIVLGMISERNRIIKVIIAENRPNQTLPNTTVALAPAPTAPAVFAMVFKVKMAASDWSTLSCFSRFKSAARFGRFSFWLSIYEGVTLNRTASDMEHRNERNIAIDTYTISITASALMGAFGFSALLASDELTMVNDSIKADIV